MKPSHIFNAVLTLLVVVVFLTVGFWVNRWLEENRILREVIERLSADSRVAEVLVTRSEYDEETKKVMTTIKFLEFGAQGKPLAPKYFSFHGNIIQFQALVVRFRDDLVKSGDRLRGKSVYLFMKAFVLEDEKTQVFDITKAHEIPAGYKVEGEKSELESKLWQKFWDYALDPAERDRAGIKNAQIEAPGSLFLPGTIYTLVIEHDGGLRIDTRPVPEILKGEKL
ncbi:MAG: hypothetical protein JW893_06640 [Candidatus Omnitrophica bacterium]|nr:hypothetical protein [Candidatus Omnitrophota bacterium]